MARKHFVFLALLSIVSVVLTKQVAESATTSPKISNSTVETLRHDFNKGALPTVQQLLNQPQWTCTIYSMRSRQKQLVQKDFYSFSPSTDNIRIKNNGVQIVKSYEPTSKGLVGNRGPIKDVLRLAPSGQLIAEFSIPTRKAANSLISPSSRHDVSAIVANNRTVLAYARCK